MSKGFSRRGADGITRHYNGNGVMTGFSQRGVDGFIRHYNGNGVMTGFSQKNYGCGGGYNHYDNRGHKSKSTKKWW